MTEKYSAPSNEHAPIEPITKIKYPGQVDIQTGNYVVTADFPNTKSGGIVAEFVLLKDAVKCAKHIINIDPRHKPVISEIDWQTHTDNTIFTSEGKTPDEIKAEIQLATELALAEIPLN